MSIPPFGTPPAPNATSSITGKVRLTNDLGGTATAPTVVNLHLSGDTAINHKLTSVTDPTSAQDAATKNYVDGVAQGLSIKVSTAVATTGSETFTIAAGTVTVIAGTTIDGQSPAVNDRILIKDAPASTGTGSAFSTQPGNGIYTVTSNTTNLSVSRSTDMSGADLPAGAFTFVEGGTVNGGSGFVVTVPSTNTGFVYGTNNIKWTQFSGAGEITVDATLIKTGNQLKRAPITSDVSIPDGSNTATLATVNSNVGMFGSNLKTVTVTANAKGLVTAISEQAILTTPAGQTPVGATRTLNTTAPLSGGGDLSADRTLTTSMSTNKLIGRSTAGTGVMEEITVGTGLSLSGGTLANTVTTPDIALSLKSPTVNEIITAGYSAYIANEYEIQLNKETEIGLLATLEIG